MNKFCDTFISYGRADSKAFATKLHGELLKEGFKVWFDQNDIPLGVDFQNQIDDGIEKAHNFLFIIAPHSVNSPYCLKEIELAIKRKKRIIPLLHVEQISQETWQQRFPHGTPQDWEAYKAQGKHTVFNNMHPTIEKINWVYFREGIDDFDTAFSGLISLLGSHVDYVDQHTQFLAKALEWERYQKQTSYLLIGEERQKAEAWLKIRFKNQQPPCVPSDLHCEYITESIKNANNLMTQVFISYADADRATMEKIRNSLRRESITVWTNKTDIQTGEAFDEAIKRGIEQADNMVYLLSPDSVNSNYCQRELDLAVSLHKRIIPVLVHETELMQVPSALRELQYIDLTDNVKEDDYLLDESQLLKIFHEDAAYYNEHKVLLTKALKWKRQHENPSILLRGYNLRSAETWLKVAQKRTQHPPTLLQEEFIAESLRQPPAESLDVFVSYSRADADFARKLNDTLQIQGKTTWFDQESIASGSDFQQEIYRGIKVCDNFLFILSPRSVNSPYCADEVEYAASLNKRFVTVLHRDVNSADLHPELAKVQWIDFNHNERDFNANFNQLVRTLDTDREHVHSHSKWLQRAIEWREKNHSPDLLLRGSELAVAEAWLKETQAQKKQPVVTELQKEYIAKSGKQKRNQHRLLIGTAGSFIGVATIAVFIGITLFLVNREKQTMKLLLQTLRAQSLLPAAPVEALVLSIQAIGESQSSPPEVREKSFFQIQSSLSDAIEDATERNVLKGHEAAVMSVALTPDGKTIVSGSVDKTIRLWDTTGKPLAPPFQGHEAAVMSVAFSPDGKTIVSGSVDNTIRLWDTTGNWHNWLGVACNRLIDHPILVASETTFTEDTKMIEVAKEASQTCQNLVWNRNPAQKAHFLVNQGWAIAREGDMEGAQAKFQDARKLISSIAVPTEALVRGWAAESWVNKGDKLVQEGKFEVGKFKEALAAYNKGQRLAPTWKISAESWNILCRDGSLHGQAAEVMQACENAVTLAPRNGEFRDSRGIARALMGDKQGAIEDFQTYIKSTDSDEKKKQRQSWIDALKAGKNPFTPVEIEKLKR